MSGDMVDVGARMSASLPSNGANAEASPEDRPANRVVNFTQNNYSPEELSEAQIYRQTKNLVSRLGVE